MILVMIIGSLLYLLLINAFLMCFTMTSRKNETNKDYVSIDDLLEDEE